MAGELFLGTSGSVCCSIQSMVPMRRRPSFSLSLTQLSPHTRHTIIASRSKLFLRHPTHTSNMLPSLLATLHSYLHPCKLCQTSFKIQVQNISYKIMISESLPRTCRDITRIHTKKKCHQSLFHIDLR